MAHTSKNVDAVEELVRSSVIHPEPHVFVQTMANCTWGNDIIVNMTSPYWKLLFFNASFYLHTVSTKK